MKDTKEEDLKGCLLSKISHQSALEMCKLSWTPHSSLEKDNSLNHACVSPNMGCLGGLHN